MGKVLDQAEAQRYEAEGYICPVPALTPVEVTEARARPRGRADGDPVAWLARAIIELARLWRFQRLPAARRLCPGKDRRRHDPAVGGAWPRSGSPGWELHTQHRGGVHLAD